MALWVKETQDRTYACRSSPCLQIYLGRRVSLFEFRHSSTFQKMTDRPTRIDAHTGDRADSSPIQVFMQSDCDLSGEGVQMGPSERLFKRSYASELFRISEEDLKTANALSKVPGIRKENILLHCQQSVEKSLKALLCWREIPIPFTHEIVVILERLRPLSPPHGSKLQDLAPYATLMRYEEGKFEITDEDIMQMIQVSDEVVTWVKEHLK